jgi:sporulation protein YlmC with PRC-barrel domain
VSQYSRDIRGCNVVDERNEDIGKVDDLMVDEADRKVRFIRVASGGILGMGKTKFLVPVDAIDRITDDTVRLRHDRNHVAGSPAYDPTIGDEAYYGRLYGYYGYPPYWAAGYRYPAIW